MCHGLNYILVEKSNKYNLLFFPNCLVKYFSLICKSQWYICIRIP